MTRDGCSNAMRDATVLMYTFSRGVRAHAPSTSVLRDKSPGERCELPRGKPAEPYEGPGKRSVILLEVAARQLPPDGTGVKRAQSFSSSALRGSSPSAATGGVSLHDVPRSLADARLIRARVAMHGLLLALEATVYSVLDDPAQLPPAFRDAARSVEDRFAMCRSNVATLMSIASLDEHSRVDAIRVALDRLEQAHTQFVCEADPRKGALALLDVLHSVSASASAWI